MTPEQRIALSVLENSGLIGLSQRLINPYRDCYRITDQGKRFYDTHLRQKGESFGHLDEVGKSSLSSVKS